MMMMMMDLSENSRIDCAYPHHDHHSFLDHCRQEDEQALTTRRRHQQKQKKKKESSNCPLKKKMVRFPEQPEDLTTIVEHLINREDLTPEDRTTMWWSNEEYHGLKQEARLERMTFEREAGGGRHHHHHLAPSSNDSNNKLLFLPESVFLEKSKDSQDRLNQWVCSSTAAAAATPSTSESESESQQQQQQLVERRGLEKTVNQGLGDARQQAQFQAIMDVLRCQDEMLISKGEVDIEEIRKVSLKSTKQARNFARMIAKADALAVNAHAGPFTGCTCSLSSDDHTRQRRNSNNNNNNNKASSSSSSNKRSSSSSSNIKSSISSFIDHTSSSSKKRSSSSSCSTSTTTTTTTTTTTNKERKEKAKQEAAKKRIQKTKEREEKRKQQGSKDKDKDREDPKRKSSFKEKIRETKAGIIARIPRRNS